MSTDLDDDEVSRLLRLLSAERLSTFLRITGSERDAIALHDQSVRIAAAAMPVTALIEIGLRNAVCDNLRVAFDKPDWLTAPPPPFSWRGPESESIARCTRLARRAAYANLSQSEKRALDAKAFPNGIVANTTHEERSKARQRVTDITSGQLIAQLSLAFWKRLFAADYENTLWKRSLRQLFPNKAITRAQVAANLEAIYQCRNRVAHHEPVVGERVRGLIEAIDFIALNFETKRPDEGAVLARLTRPYRSELLSHAERYDELIRPFVIRS